MLKGFRVWPQVTLTMKRLKSQVRAVRSSPVLIEDGAWSSDPNSLDAEDRQFVIACVSRTVGLPSVEKRLIRARLPQRDLLRDLLFPYQSFRRQQGKGPLGGFLPTELLRMM